MVVHHALQGLDFHEDTVVRVIDPVRTVKHKGPLAAGAELEGFKGAGETIWPKPARQLLRITEGFKHLLTRMRKQARAEDFVIGGRCIHDREQG